MRFALADERGNCRITGVAAIPIGLAFDFDRLEHRRQAGRSEEHLGRNLRVAKYAAAARSNVGGGYKQSDRSPRDLTKVDTLGENVAQGIGALLAKIVRREDTTRQVKGQVKW